MQSIPRNTHSSAQNETANAVCALEHKRTQIPTTPSISTWISIGTEHVTCFLEHGYIVELEVGTRIKSAGRYKTSDASLTREPVAYQNSNANEDQNRSKHTQSKLPRQKPWAIVLISRIPGLRYSATGFALHFSMMAAHRIIGDILLFPIMKKAFACFRSSFYTSAQSLLSQNNL